MSKWIVNLTWKRLCSKTLQVKFYHRSLFCSSLMSPLRLSATLAWMCLVSHRQPTSDSKAGRVTHARGEVASSHTWEWLAFVPHDAGLQRPSDPITLQATVVTVCLECNSISAGWARRTDVGQTGSAAVGRAWFISAGVLRTSMHLS